MLGVRRTILALALVLGSCSSGTTGPDCPSGGPALSATPAPSVEPKQTAPISITVRERVGDRWEVSYRFAEPVRGVLLERASRFRASKWSVTADGGETAVRWSELDGHEAIITTGASPMRELRVQLTTDTGEKTADYLVHASFSDGSRLFYTGHFAARALRCKSAEPCPELALDRGGELLANDIAWRFETEEGRDVQVLDRRATAQLDWSPAALPPGRGTYVYFGTIKAQQTSFGSVIIDPGLPKWMAESATTLIPRMLELYERETGVKLTVRPLLLIGAPSTEGSGRSSKGGGLPGLVQLSAWGEGWNNEKDSREPWLQFLAHELFHIWNGDLFQRRGGPGDAWLTEGSSDYFAWRALRALGVIDERRMSELVVRAANHCLVTLGPSALLTARMQGARPEYTCGALSWALLDGIAKSKQQTAGTLLGRVFAKAREGDGKYDTEDVLDEARALGSGTSGLALLETLFDKGLSDGGDVALTAELGKIGIATRRVAPSKVPLDNLRHATLLGRELSRCDCEGRVAITTTEAGLWFHDVPECPTLKDVRVVGYGANALPKDAGIAFDALVVRKDARTVELRVEGKAAALKVKCRQGYTPLPFTTLLELSD